MLQKTKVNVICVVSLRKEGCASEYTNEFLTGLGAGVSVSTDDVEMKAASANPASGESVMVLKFLSYSPVMPSGASSPVVLQKLPSPQTE